jgi:hypothetical protein
LVLVVCASREAGQSFPPLWRCRFVHLWADETAAAVLLRRAAAKDSPGVVWLEDNNLPVVVLGAVCDFLPHISSLAWLQPR